MRYIIYGINNEQYYDVRECLFADTKEEAEEIKESFEKKFPLVQIKIESEE